LSLGAKEKGFEADLEQNGPCHQPHGCANPQDLLLLLLLQG